MRMGWGRLGWLSSWQMATCYFHGGKQCLGKHLHRMFWVVHLETLFFSPQVPDFPKLSKESTPESRLDSQSWIEGQERCPCCIQSHGYEQGEIGETSLAMWDSFAVSKTHNSESLSVPFDPPFIFCFCTFCFWLASEFYARSSGNVTTSILPILKQFPLVHSYPSPITVIYLLHATYIWCFLIYWLIEFVHLFILSPAYRTWQETELH